MTIVACGGMLFSEEAGLREYVLGLADVERPRVCLVPTASGDRDDSIALFEQQLGAVAEVSHLALFRRTVEDVRAHLLAQDVILVSGGNTASMLAVWRRHGVDSALREAWERGIVLAGSSAGGLCWFEGGVTDSFGPELAALEEGLGFLDGSFCPHYDSEAGRRPLYTRLVAHRVLPAGFAADDHVALHFAGTELSEIVAARAGARAFRVEATGEQELAVRLL